MYESDVNIRFGVDIRRDDALGSSRLRQWQVSVARIVGFTDSSYSMILVDRMHHSTSRVPGARYFVYPPSVLDPDAREKWMHQGKSPRMFLLEDPVKATEFTADFYRLRLIKCVTNVVCLEDNSSLQIPQAASR